MLHSSKNFVHDHENHINMFLVAPVTNQTRAERLSISNVDWYNKSIIGRCDQWLTAPSLGTSCFCHRRSLSSGQCWGDSLCRTEETIWFTSCLLHNGQRLDIMVVPSPVLFFSNKSGTESVCEMLDSDCLGDVSKILRGVVPSTSRNVPNWYFRSNLISWSMLPD